MLHVVDSPPPRPRLELFKRKHLRELPQLQRMSEDTLLQLEAVSAVFPFRVNRYVLEQLIDWDAVPDDPIYQLTFPQPGMLAPDVLGRLVDLLRGGAPREALQATVREIRATLNPHPAGQLELNVPRNARDEAVWGVQHKYRETVLFFPAAGQTCHAYCTYCFRWPQFVGEPDLRQAARQSAVLVDYLKAHPEVTSVLITGGDPMVMKTKALRRVIEPLLVPELAHVTSIRIGSKSLSYWPHRFTTDDDADDALRLFEEVRASGRTLAFMAHYTHPRELEPPAARAALRRVQDAGAEVRCQAPLIRHVNDDAESWKTLLAREVQLGAHPYYMFVERDTGARGWFEVPLARAHAIYAETLRSLTGLARTVRGPSMSCTPGKIMVDDVVEIGGEKTFALKFLQARDPAWVGKVFFARFDPEATWIDQLEPAFGEARFFWEAPLERMQLTRQPRPWLSAPPGTEP